MMTMAGGKAAMMRSITAAETASRKGREATISAITVIAIVATIGTVEADVH